ncbi:cuticle protein 63-like [Pieris brassicae]|uniref:Cuticle protein n=1 Tax=Pieris brassicae TaxID=7116 RepID=A0A9P0TN80_PIEBR|nr:cuticle protein 63-like [Pieris brassicae]CAH4031699.1 unnamed protein product [Pieris brassicae]
MRAFIFFALVALASAKPTPGFLSGYGGYEGLGGYGALSLGHESALTFAQPAISVAHAPVIQAAPIVHAPVAVAHAPASSYSSFQRVIHPSTHAVVQAAPVVHAAPVAIAQPVIHAAPALAPAVISHAPLATYASSYGHGWGHGW